MAFPRIIRTNATVDIESVTVTQGADGGTVETFPTVVASAVPVLISLFAVGRDGSFGTDAHRDRGTLSGSHASLGRSDVRLKVISGPATLGMDGWYLRVSDPTSHPGGRMVPPRVQVKWERIELPRQT